MLRSVDHWELPTWTWANFFTLLFASAQKNQRNYVFSSRAVVLPQLKHQGKAWRPQMKSSSAAPAYKIKKRLCDPPAAAIKQTLFPAQSPGQRMKRVHKGLWQQQELHESKLCNKATISCIQAPLWKGINIWQTFCKGHKLERQNI